MKLSVIIVSYNVKYYLEQCMGTLYRSGEGVEMEIFVVDNASTDGTQEYLKTKFSQEKFPTLRLIENTVNIGFGKANNLALRESKGEYILFINPDTMVGEECLKTCVNFLDKHEDAGALGVRMLKPNGAFAPESRRGMPTPFTSLCKVSGLSKMFPHSRLFGRYYMQYQDEWKENKIDVVSGAFMMVKHQVLDKVGGFDEDFFMYGEDIDLSYRIQKAGFQNYYLPTPILHYKGESTEKSSYRYVYVFYEAMLIFFDKHYKHYGLLLSIPIKAAVFALGLNALFQNKVGHLFSSKHGEKLDSGKKYLFIGSHKMLEETRELCRRKCFKADFVEGSEDTLPKGHLNLNIVGEDYGFVVYDRSVFRIETILKIFDAAEKKENLMGTYDVFNHILITNQNVFTL
jgi:N-acetylglucosaminyl-diphospho-decaprenol L-rhamnosyltransferase